MIRLFHVAATAAALVAASAAVAVPLTALTTNNQLLTYDTANVGVPVAPAAIPITGLTGTTGETVLGIDYRPSTGALYGVTNQSRLYTINPTTGVATTVGALSTAINLGGTNPAIGFDFNPVPDAIRIIANRSGQNLRVNPTTGVATVDTTIPAYPAGDAFAGNLPQISAVGYLPPSGGFTTLYGFDDTTDRIVRIGDVNSTPNTPNGGVTTTVGGLGGVNGSHLAGMDVSTAGVGYLSLDVGGSVFRLFQIDLTVTNPNTNAATLLGTFNAGGASIGDIAVVPEPAGMAAVGVGLVACLRRRRRQA